MQHQSASFQSTYSPGIPELLASLNISLVLSTYQAGKLIFLSPYQGGLIQLPRNFQKPMGLALNGNMLAVATRHEVVVLANDPRLARIHPSRPGQYDAFFVPRATYFTNEMDIHDMTWAGDSLWAVNTLFSCLCHIDHHYSFTPQWQPPFISQLAPDDRCHLNGMVLVDGRPEYVTALGTTDVIMGWREEKESGGMLMHVPSGEIVLSHLPMPHSPRIYDGELYALLSLTGELVRVDPQRGTYEAVAQVPGFVRGLARHGEYVFVGLSKLRPNRVLGDIPIDPDKMLPGVAVIHLPSGRVMGLIQYLSDCEEIYDVQVLPNMRRPGIVGLGGDMYREALSTPENGFWGQPLGERHKR